jgi:catechol 2,3-dioxygenase-like lactoylglutathione lyase family enzyme
MQIRVARPTDKLEEIIAFYRDGLGLPVIGHFEGHAGYTGVMFGMPDDRFHLEFTHAELGSPYPAPSEDNLLVLYMSSLRDHLVGLSRLSGRSATEFARRLSGILLAEKARTGWSRSELAHSGWHSRMLRQGWWRGRGVCGYLGTREAPRTERT